MSNDNVTPSGAPFPTRVHACGIAELNGGVATWRAQRGFVGLPVQMNAGEWAVKLAQPIGLVDIVGVAVAGGAAVVLVTALGPNTPVIFECLAGPQTVGGVVYDIDMLFFEPFAAVQQDPDGFMITVLEF